MCPPLAQTSSLRVFYGGSFTVYDYTGLSLRNFGANTFNGQSSVIGWGAGLFGAFQQEFSTSYDKYGGILMGNRLSLGVGQGLFGSFTIGDSQTDVRY